jgi:hypothetical protein
MGYIQRMLKSSDSMKDLEHQAAAVLRGMLQKVPAVDTDSVSTESRPRDARYDFVVHVASAGQHRTLVCEVKANGQPRHVRAAVLALRDWVEREDKSAVPVVIAPYLSNEARTICSDYKVGYLDFEGNCHIAFDGIYIEREVPKRPTVERRDLKSLFSLKSAQVLRRLLRDPLRQWRVTDLAEQTVVSVGHISNVRKALIDKEWAEVGDDGLRLTKPDALLDAWRDAYEPPSGEQVGLYTTLHGASFDEAARHIFDDVTNASPSVMLASFSAARWQAPYARTGSQFFYASNEGLARLKEMLKLAPAAKGENVFVTVLDDDAFFRDNDNSVPGIVCTSPVQTYLDLTASGERGREAAEHLRKEKLKWPI